MRRHSTKALSLSLLNTTLLKVGKRFSCIFLGVVVIVFTSLELALLSYKSYYFRFIFLLNNTIETFL